MPKVKEKTMNKILIKCDGEKIVLNTIRTISDIVRLLELNRESRLLLIDNHMLDDEGFKEEIVINPRFITLVKDITLNETQEVKTCICIDNNKVATQLRNDEVLQDLANKITNEIKKQQRNSCSIINV